MAQAYKHSLKYNIANLGPKESVLEAFPELSVYPEFQSKDDRFLRYVIFCYDMGSGLVKIKDSVKRKEEAMKLAGFKQTAKGWDDVRCELAMAMVDIDVKAMIVRYLKSCLNAPKYAFWVMGNEMVWQNIAKIATPIEVDTDLLSPEQEAKAKGTEKETDVQRAYATRNSLFEELPGQLKKLEDIEKEIFIDTETRDLAAEDVSTINAGSVERRILRAQ